tara:strand:- start:662 stop:1096 length:435 start_codon:yes stop_codon:yes gene_type:complete
MVDETPLVEAVPVGDEAARSLRDALGPDPQTDEERFEEAQRDTATDEVDEWRLMIRQGLEMWNPIAAERCPLWVFAPIEVTGISSGCAPALQQLCGSFRMNVFIQAAVVLLPTVGLRALSQAALNKKKTKDAAEAPIAEPEPGE